MEHCGHERLCRIRRWHVAWVLAEVRSNGGVGRGVAGDLGAGVRAQVPVNFSSGGLAAGASSCWTMRPRGRGPSAVTGRSIRLNRPVARRFACRAQP